MLVDRRPEHLKELEPGIFYVSINLLTNEEWKQALPALASAKGVIFDFRGYPASFSDVNSFFGTLSKVPVTSPQWKIPIVEAPDHVFNRFQESNWQLKTAEPYINAKRVFLIDGRAISYAESCMGIVEHYKLGEIVGTATAGTNGNVNPLALPGGYTLRWTGMKVLKHDGTRHHGVGIQPTVPVERTRAGVAAGRDEILERGIAVLKAAN